MGYIIVIEGTDGSGKQTQTEKLYQKLLNEGFNVIRQSFPNYESASSAPVKMYLNGELCETANQLDAYQTSSLFAIDRLCTYQSALKQHYENGGIIIFDRYVESNMLHQACKIEDLDERNKYLSWLDEFEFGYLKLPRPNKILFLDMPVEMSLSLAKDRALKAGTKKDIHEQDVNHLKNAYNAGKYVASKFGWNIIKCMDNDRLKTVDEIHQDIYFSIIDELKSI